MGGPWRERSIEKRLPPIPVAQGRVADARIAPEALTAAVIGFVVALMTSLGVSLACFAYLR
jgi:hypothetical protein